MARADPLDGEFSLYRQVETILRDQIVDGALRPGDRLPAEEALRAEYGVSRGTLRQALDALERDGLVERTRGRGTFVSSGTARHVDRARLGLDAMIAEAGRAVRLMRSGSAVPPPVVTAALRLRTGEEAPFFIRLSGEGKGGRIGVKRYLAPALTDRLADLAEAADFDAMLAGFGKPARAEAWVEAILAEPRFAMQLKVPLGSALLSLWWVDALDGAPAACTQMIRPGASAALGLGTGKETA